MGDYVEWYEIDDYNVQKNGIIRDRDGIFIGRLNDLQLYQKENTKLKIKLEEQIEHNVFITKRFDENYEAYKNLKSENTKLKELVGVYEECLKPFAIALEAHYPLEAITFGNLNKAKTALAKGQQIKEK